MEPTTDQEVKFRQELQALRRRYTTASDNGVAVRTVVDILLANERVSAEFLRCLHVSWRTDAQLRRIRQAGFDAGYDQGYNDALAEEATTQGESK